MLNKKQKHAWEKINQFIDERNLSTFYLLGYAGTGKTYLIGQIVGNMIATKKIDQVFICAPTHQALNVIESSIRLNIVDTDNLNKIRFMTIHKLLEFKPIIVTSDGSKTFKSIKESKFFKQPETKLIIIDECSMISKQMVTELEKYAELYPIKIIFMGDRKQLPPIGEPESLIFTNIPKKYQYQILLDEIMRTKSPEIKEVCNIIRNWNKKDDLLKLLLPVHNKKSNAFKLYHKKTDYVNSSWFKYVVSKLANQQIPIILPWKNETVNFYNMVIRKHIYGQDNLSNFVIGDYVIFNNFYQSIDGDFFYTSDMIKILEINEKEHVPFNWSNLIISNPKSKLEKYFNTMIKKLDSIKYNIRINIFTASRINVNNLTLESKKSVVKTIHCADLSEYETMINNITEHIEFFFSQFRSDKLTNKLWKIFHTYLIDPYAHIKFGYSTTVYKSQGSTFPIVIVDIEDLASLKSYDEFQLALYTAAGRAGCQLRFLV